MASYRILLAGCGAMGGSLQESWRKANPSLQVTVIDPARHQCLPDPALLPEGYLPHIVVFAVKPQVIPSTLPLYTKFSGQGCLFISVAMGVPLNAYHAALGEGEMIVRAMPNIAVSAGQGTTVLATRSCLTENQRALAEMVFRTSGLVMWIDNEARLDVVTALSGSGPAYFFFLVEILARIGVAEGLTEETAMCLARQTAIGSGAVLQSWPEKMPVELRQGVTSPGGTTQAALAVLEADGALQELFSLAVKAAINQAQELSR